MAAARTPPAPAPSPAPGPAPTGIGLLRGAFAVAAKDLRIEMRAKEIGYAMAFLAAQIVLLFAFAATKEGRADAAAAAGVLWIAVAVAGTIGLGRVYERERESGTMRALLLAPVPRNAIYLGKLLAIVALMLLVEAVAAPLVALLLGAPLFAHPLPLVALLLLGTVAYAAPGALFAAMLLRTRGRDILLGILLYPIIVPVLIAGARGTEALVGLEPDVKTAWFWAQLLAVFDAIFLVVALWTFEPLAATE